MVTEIFVFNNHLLQTMNRSNFIFFENPDCEAFDIILQKHYPIDLSAVGIEFFFFFFAKFSNYFINLFIFIMPITVDEKIKSGAHSI